jgi:carbon-monoxide dehydrogenase medium subunit
LRPFVYYAPNSLSEAISLLQHQGPGGKLLAGGTDLLVQIKERGMVPKYVVSLRKVSELQSLTHNTDGSLTIGARVTMRRLELDPAVLQRFSAIAQAAALVGSIQVRNSATVGGNLCNAAPSADTAPAFIALGAQVHLTGPQGERTIPVEQLFAGPGRTSLNSGEVLTSITVPTPGAHSGSAYLRHTPRAELDIAVVGVAASVTLLGGAIAEARISLAAVAPVPVRASAAEAALTGKAPTAEVIAAAAKAVQDSISPISDQRGSAGFRRTLSEVLTRRALQQALAAAQ